MNNNTYVFILPLRTFIEIYNTKLFEVFDRIEDKVWGVGCVEGGVSFVIYL